LYTMGGLVSMTTKDSIVSNTLSLDETGLIARACLLRFFDETDFHRSFNVRPDPEVQQRMLDIVSGWGLDVPPEKQAKCFACLDAGAIVFHATPPDVQVAIGLFALCAALFDDGAVSIEAMREFVPNFYTGVPQTHPALIRLLESTLRLRQHATPLMSNMLVTSVMEYANTEVFLKDGGIDAVEQLRPESVEFVEHLREKDGFPEVFVAGIWPIELFPDAKTYVQAIPETSKFVNWTKYDIIYMSSVRCTTETRLLQRRVLLV